MPTATPIQGHPLPANLDAPLTASDMAALADSMEKYDVMAFATVADRDAKILTANRRAGMISWVAALGRHDRVIVDGGAWVPLSGASFAGTELAIIGANPPAGTLKIVQSYSDTVSVSNASGGIAKNFPTAFPNGLVVASVTAGDTFSGLGFTTPLAANHTLAAWNGVAYQPGGAAVVQGSPIRVNVYAEGW